MELKQQQQQLVIHMKRTKDPSVARSVKNVLQMNWDLICQEQIFKTFTKGYRQIFF